MIELLLISVCKECVEMSYAQPNYSTNYLTSGTGQNAAARVAVVTQQGVYKS